MDIDLGLYRHEVRVSSDPLVHLSAIDISPERPQRTLVFIHGFGRQAMQWHYQLHKFALKDRVSAATGFRIGPRLALRCPASKPTWRPRSA